MEEKKKRKRKEKFGRGLSLKGKGGRTRIIWHSRKNEWLSSMVGITHRPEGRGGGGGRGGWQTQYQ